MSKKALYKENLEKLGAEKLAELVIDLVQGSAALQRRARHLDYNRDRLLHSPGLDGL